MRRVDFKRYEGLNCNIFNPRFNQGSFDKNLRK